MAAPFTLLLAVSLAAAGCGASSDDSASDKAPAVADQGSRADSADGSGSGSEGSEKNGAAAPTGATGTSAAPTGAAGSAKTPPPAATYLVRTANLTVQTSHVADALTSARAPWPTAWAATRATRTPRWTPRGTSSRRSSSGCPPPRTTGCSHS